ncbi:MAG: Mu transposase C-terminal domain-containing protein [Sphingomonadales bacterium]|nr:Mu transposase C-terminal domain-containing protein [Sphingomonadales bacterium]MBD3772094.1 Mu transposase C-terminal domain-containing protein [Paracoccaceae bacterium]
MKPERLTTWHDAARSAPIPAVAQPQERCWFSAAELADLRLPGLPGSKRSVARKAKDERWASRTCPDGELLARPRMGQGGGLEFHLAVLPGPARVELVRRGVVSPPDAERPEAPQAGNWEWFDQQSQDVRERAAARLEAMREIDVLERAGSTTTAAIALVSARHDVSQATLWNWRKLIEGVAASDWLPALAERRKGGGKKAEMDELLWREFLSDWMRPEEPPLSSCYRRAQARATERGMSLPSEKALRRRIEREVDPAAIMLARKGKEALERSIPDNRRTLESLHAMHMVNIDGHVFDVFVTPPDGGKKVRPVMVAIQDVYSRKILAWRLDLSENVLATRLAFADLFRNFGIPRICLLDNSRTFASLALTAGARTRYRNKIRDEDPAGLLVSLGIEVRFAQIYHGQSKPIERAFRDIASDISRSPACAGAYTGNSPTNKPANYDEREVPWAEFESIVAQGIADHNARIGRRGGVCNGRSFDQTFDQSYAVKAIRKATPEQLRMALLAAERKRVNSRTGEISLFGNRYWSPECRHYHGQMVTVRFDPDDLHSEVHLYGHDGAYLTTAPVIEDYGFADQAGAKAASKRKKDHRKLARETLRQEALIEAEELAARQPRTAAAELPDPGVVELAPVRRTAGAAVRKVAPAPRVTSESESRVFSALRLVRGTED